MYYIVIHNPAKVNLFRRWMQPYCSGQPNKPHHKPSGKDDRPILKRPLDMQLPLNKGVTPFPASHRTHFLQGCNFSFTTMSPQGAPVCLKGCDPFRLVLPKKQLGLSER